MDFYFVEAYAGWRSWTYVLSLIEQQTAYMKIKLNENKTK